MYITLIQGSKQRMLNMGRSMHRQEGDVGLISNTPLSMVSPVVGASSKDDIQAERQAMKEMKSWA